MIDPASQTQSGYTHKLSLIAYGLFLVGFILPVLCWTFWLPKPLLLVASGIELAALYCGIRTWRQRRGKIAVIGAILFLLFAAWLAQNGFPTYPLKIQPTADWMKPLAEDWIAQSAAKPWSIGTDSSLKRNGQDSLRFELRAGDKWVDQTFMATFRTEMAVGDFPPALATKWYALSVFFPKDFPIEDNRLVIAQWKDREGLLQGFQRAGTSPPLAFRFVNGKFTIQLRQSAAQIIRNADEVSVETVFKKSHFRLGVWHDFVVQAKWSCQSDGLVNIWWNNRQIVEYHGPVGYNQDSAPKFKFGLYRDETDKTYIAWFNQVKVGDLAPEVGFDPALATRYQDN
jgi:hypothetical protein